MTGVSLKENVKLHPTHLVVIQASPFCNIDCTYCYLPDRLNPERMAESTFSKVLDYLFEDPSTVAGDLKFLWHSGEPLAIPQSFYEAVFELQQQRAHRGITIHNSIQTNGTLIDEKWCGFFQKWGVEVGVSLDGSERLHNSKRVDRAGQGTYRRAIRGINTLRQFSIPFHVICVLSEASLSSADEIWLTCTSLGVTHLHFLMEEIQGVNVNRILSRLRLTDRCETFFRRLMELRTRDRSSMYIREVDMAIERKAFQLWQWKEIEQLAGAIISIDVKGNIATFSPELIGNHVVPYGKLVFGNVHENRRSDLPSNAVFQMVSRDINAGFRRCQSECGYYSQCGGGYPSIKLYENGAFDSTETPSCQMRVQAALNSIRESYSEQGNSLFRCEIKSLSGSGK